MLPTRRRAAFTVSAALSVGGLLFLMTGAQAGPRTVPAPDIPVDAVTRDLKDLQRAARENGGNRAHGEPGYQASVEHLRNRLDAAGFDTTVQEFTAGGSTGWNLIADWPGGDDDRVLLTGAHLDSVHEGPGINDNASGSAAILHVALAVAEADLQPAKHLRFAWWGAEERDLDGAVHYVDALERDDLEALTAYLNADMLGSPNPGYFVYDSDAELEKVFTGWFTERGVPTEPVDMSDGMSDHAPFMEADIPVGGIYTGSDEIMSSHQADMWGGRAGEPFDPCYHATCDDVTNISEQALDRNSDAFAHAVWQLST